MRIALTGAHGFLGWHTRCFLAGGEHEVVPVGRDQWTQLTELLAGCDAVLHLAGVNRGAADEVATGNQQLARDLVAALEEVGSAPNVVFAGSVHQTTDTPYGRGKQEASDMLASWATRSGAQYTDVVLPNLFGEHGRPHYNSFVATFVDSVVRGHQPAVNDNQVELLHAQAAARELVDAAVRPAGRTRPRGTEVAVREVWDRLGALHGPYRDGEIPVLRDELDRDLFNQLRVEMFLAHGPHRLHPREDDRGRLVETTRCHGPGGQTFVSTTVPGITRGEHFHRRKVERFVVLEGRASIQLRRLFTRQVHTFDVTGDEPVAIDMPTLWTHNITNTGSTTLTTMFWTNELFDPLDPDTVPIPVSAREESTCR